MPHKPKRLSKKELAALFTPVKPILFTEKPKPVPEVKSVAPESNEDDYVIVERPIHRSGHFGCGFCEK